jgi:hypothetical protein
VTAHFYGAFWCRIDVASFFTRIPLNARFSARTSLNALLCAHILKNALFIVRAPLNASLVRARFSDRARFIIVLIVFNAHHSNTRFKGARAKTTVYCARLLKRPFIERALEERTFRCLAF